MNFIAQHYGCAGKAFIEALADEQLAAEYNDIMKLVLEVTGTTEKQAMAMALMLQADAIASRAIFNDPLNVLSPEDVAAFVRSKAEVDTAERAFNIMLDVFAANADKFDTELGDFNGHTYWGRVKPAGVLQINKTVLEQQLAEAGFDYAAIKKKWAEAGHLLKTKQGKFYSVITLNGIRANYVNLFLNRN